MDGDLVPRPVEFLDLPVDSLLVVVQDSPACSGGKFIRLRYRRRAAAHTPVHEDLDRPHLDPLRSESPFDARGQEGVRPLIQDEGVEAEGKFPRRFRILVSSKGSRIDKGVMGAYESQAVEPGSAAGHHLHSSLLVILGHHLGIDRRGGEEKRPHECGLAQDAVGIALRIPVYHPSGWVGGFLAEAQFLQGKGVDHASVDGDVHQADGVFLGGPVQVFPGQVFLIVEEIRGIAPPHDPFSRLGFLCLGPEGLHHILSPPAPGCRAAVGLIGQESVEAEMAVGVDEPWKHGLALQVDHRGFGGGQSLQLLVSPDPEDPPELHRQGLRLRRGRLHGQDVAVLEKDFHNSSPPWVMNSKTRGH